MNALEPESAALGGLQPHCSPVRVRAQGTQPTTSTSRSDRTNILIILKRSTQPQAYATYATLAQSFCLTTSAGGLDSSGLALSSHSCVRHTMFFLTRESQDSKPLEPQCSGWGAGVGDPTKNRNSNSDRAKTLIGAGDPTKNLNRLTLDHLEAKHPAPSRAAYTTLPRPATYLPKIFFGGAETPKSNPWEPQSVQGAWVGGVEGEGGRVGEGSW